MFRALGCQELCKYNMLQWGQGLIGDYKRNNLLFDTITSDSEGKPKISGRTSPVVFMGNHSVFLSFFALRQVQSKLTLYLSPSASLG